MNEASFRRKLDPISRNIIKNQNPIEQLFKDVKHFDAQNPVIGYLIREFNIGKKGLSKFLAKAPNIGDLQIRSRLNKLHEKFKFFNKGNDDNNNNSNNNNNNFALLPPPSPPPRPSTYFLPPFQPQTLSDFFLDNQAGNFSQQPSYAPPPPLLPLPPAPSLRLRRLSDMKTNTTQTLSIA